MSSPHDPEDDLAQFKNDLRRLRITAKLSYRALANRAYFSRTTAANAEKGERLPTLGVVRSFVRACAGDIESFEARWRELAVVTRADLVTVGIGSSPAAAASPWPQRPVADGADPDEAGCSVDAITVHARRIALAGQRQIVGQVELRYCRRAQAAWGRFKGYRLLDHLASKHDVDVLVEVVREQDAKRATYRASYGFDYHWGDLLLVNDSLFYASTTISIDGKTAAYGETDRMSLG